LKLLRLGIEAAGLELLVWSCWSGVAGAGLELPVPAPTVRLSSQPLTAKAGELVPAQPPMRTGETIGSLTGALREMLVAPTRSALEAKPHCWQEKRD